MTTLTQRSIEQIADAVTKHAFKERFARSFAEENRLGAEVAREVWAPFGKAVTLTAASGLPVKAPNGLYNQTDGFGVLTPTGNIEISLADWIPVPAVIKDGYSKPRVNVSVELANRVADFGFERKNLARERSGSRDQIIAAVRSFGTWKKLASGWPEIMPIARAFQPEAKEVRALVNVGPLNTALGLPPELEVA